MLEPVRVWRVHLRRGDAAEREGTLSLADDALVFVDRATEETTRMPLASVRSVRRVRGSPIMVVVHLESDAKQETAFYFSQPPPLELPSPGSIGTSAMGRPLGPFGAMRRTSKRRHQRENVRYLSARSSMLKPVIDTWVREISVRRRGWRR